MPWGKSPSAVSLYMKVRSSVVVTTGEIQTRNTLAHAEITAINKASKVIGDWRLEECTLYVTLEPCQMCAGAIVQARIPEVVMGCMNPKAGCAGSILNILEMPQFNHQVKVTRGILETECSQMLKTFFEELRIRNKQEKGSQEVLKQSLVTMLLLLYPVYVRSFEFSEFRQLAEQKSRLIQSLRCIQDHKYTIWEYISALGFPQDTEQKSAEHSNPGQPQ